MISTELVRRGYDVSAVVADYGQSVREHHSGVELTRGVPEAISGISSIIGAFYGLVRSMHTVGADLYLVRGAPRLATATFLVSKVLRKRFVFRVANDSDVDPSYLKDRYDWFFNHLYRVSVGHADAVIAQTQKQQQLLKEHFGIEAKLVPNGYDLPPSSDLISHRERSHILWVGSSDPKKKNPHLFLQLAERLPGLKFKMISQPIAGKEDFHEELKRKAVFITNLDFVGPVAPDEVHSYYRAAMLLINTSSYEGFPNTFLEAWRYETPIVSLHFDLDGLLEDEQGGVRAGTIETLVEVVGQLAEELSTRARLGKKGRVYMKKNFSLDEVVSLYEEAFEAAIE